MSKVAIIQSNYLPWKGYFDIIHDVDLFIFYDDVQYTQGDWRNRNKVKTAAGPRWITIPVGSPKGRLIHEIDLTSNWWQSKHWKTIKQAYRKRPFFEQYQAFFKAIYEENDWKNLSRMNQQLIREISVNLLGIKTEFRDSRIYEPVGGRVERLIDILKKAGASHYISGPAAKNYLSKEQFLNAGIELSFKNYSGYPEYDQQHPPFEHKVSIIDVLFNCGPKAPEYIWGWRERTQEPIGNFASYEVNDE